MKMSAFIGNINAIFQTLTFINYNIHFQTMEMVQIFLLRFMVLLPHLPSTHSTGSLLNIILIPDTNGNIDMCAILQIIT